MKIAKLFFALIALSISTSTFAHSGPEYPTVSEEIMSIIKDANFELDGSDKVVINFLINSENKLILISTNDKSNEKRLRSLLDLKDVNWSGEADINTIYTLPLVINKSK